ncbi:TIM44 subunit of mitochondria import inner membrane translocase [Coniochaeta ligniaria NRRL 30616]|uniref:Mitochondrial import inner membrane translocase subunit TIM44 n=1 Tax=Coniochaeta ligniaria NRRL 30616 TaxID=1408157 RepID=A0A1J7JPV7_9PEZI|nr:TIM44 subunit of mitochondria import inner membrane translocase [Coniochaeta ligniaria NRRL 30616]
MASLRNVLRTTPPNSLSRASTLSTSSYGRSPAYRRLISSRPILLASDDAALRSPLPSLQPSPLRSQFLPQSILLQGRSSARSFHISSRSLAAEKPSTEAKSSQPGQTSEPTSESKTESTAEEQARTEQEGESKEGEEKAEDGAKKEKKEDLPPPPPHGDKTPWQVFMETMQSEFKQSKEWNESTKALASSAHQFTESESVRKAREAYEATTGAVSSTTGKIVKTTAGALGKGAQWTWETPVMKGVRKGANITGEVLDKATKPIRETEAFKNVKDVIDDGSSSRYGGWVDKEERKRRREEFEKMHGGKPGEVLQEDPNAGTNVTLHKDAAWKEAWRDFKDSNKVVQGLFSMKSIYAESENPLISTARSITDKVAGFFAENETAMVIKKLRSMDPAFQIEPFLRELREYILPEVLDAYVKGDVATLKLWLSEAQYSVYEALTKQYLQAGLKSDGRILDIRHVDILRARMLEPGEIPVFIITCRTQEVHVYRNAKTNQLAAGMEDKVQLVTYAIGITRVPEDVNNPETRGWRLIEMQKSGRDYI